MFRFIFLVLPKIQYVALTIRPEGAFHKRKGHQQPTPFSRTSSIYSYATIKNTHLSQSMRTLYLSSFIKFYKNGLDVKVIICVPIHVKCTCINPPPPSFQAYIYELLLKSMIILTHSYLYIYLSNSKMTSISYDFITECMTKWKHSLAWYDVAINSTINTCILLDRFWIVVCISDWMAKWIRH